MMTGNYVEIIKLLYPYSLVIKIYKSSDANSQFLIETFDRIHWYSFNTIVLLQEQPLFFRNHHIVFPQDEVLFQNIVILIIRFSTAQNTVLWFQKSHIGQWFDLQDAVPITFKNVFMISKLYLSLNFHPADHLQSQYY